MVKFYKHFHLSFRMKIEIEIKRERERESEKELKQFQFSSAVVKIDKNLLNSLEDVRKEYS